MENYIENLDELIYQYTGPTKRIIKKDISNLTLPGENYFSVMLKIDVTLKNLENDEEEVLHAAAKCRIRGYNSFFTDVAPIQFNKEIGFYTDIAPVLQQFQREQGIEDVLDIFPKVLAVRRNLSGVGDEIDEHAVILMENLKEQGLLLFLSLLFY